MWFVIGSDGPSNDVEAGFSRDGISQAMATGLVGRSAIMARRGNYGESFIG